jgi:hypothetical protein
MAETRTQLNKIQSLKPLSFFNTLPYKVGMILTHLSYCKQFLNYKFYIMSTTKKDQQNNQGNNHASENSKGSAQPKQNQNSPKKQMQGNDNSADKKDRTQSR